MKVCLDFFVGTYNVNLTSSIGNKVCCKGFIILKLLSEWYCFWHKVIFAAVIVAL